MRTSTNGIAVAHHFESCKLEAYPDPGSSDGKPWTIGWGHTGPEVIKGLRWTQRQADAAFIADLMKFERAVTSLITVKLTQGQFDALVLFTYNVGENSLATSTLRRILNAGDYAGVPAQLARWNKNDGKIMKGLIRRRAAEAALWDGWAAETAIQIGTAGA